MNSAVSQPIAGVSTGRETVLEAVYPSIASGSLGQFIGKIMQSPARIQNTPGRLVALLFCGAAMGPLSVLAYFSGKIFGTYHAITNRSVEERKILGSRKLQSWEISGLESVDITTRPGYEYHRVGDLVLKDAQGTVLHVIPAIVHPEMTRHLLLESKLGRQRTAAAMAQIESRGS